VASHIVCSLEECWRSLSVPNIPRKCSGSHENSSVLQRRQSKYILEGRSRRRWGRGLGRGLCPLPRNVFGFWISKWRFVVSFLVQFFCSSAKNLRGRKDTLVQVYFYWGQLPPRPPPRDRRHWCSRAVHFSGTFRVVQDTAVL